MAADRVFGARLLLKSPATHAGYMAWAPHWVAVMQRSPAATAATAWLAVPWSHAMADDVGLPLPPPPGDDRLAFRLRGRLVMVVGGWICWVIGMVARAVAPLVANPIPVITAIVVASLAWSTKMSRRLEPRPYWLGGIYHGYQTPFPFHFFFFRRHMAAVHHCLALREAAAAAASSMRNDHQAKTSGMVRPCHSAWASRRSKRGGKSLSSSIMKQPISVKICFVV